ncbi:piggyBac transposable element-derived protein 4 isoform X1 [Misgurnus anguillicaudatus]|uniref:piggyBac transposable element-derived protein 4 isoform X1 n=1 Tax=Misgurnus anguillicaudatus TaxID=75329 RepID=UPI003CCF5926
MSRSCILNCEGKFVLFSLPKEQNVRNQWIEFVFSAMPQQYNPNLFLCSRHFTDDCFSNIDNVNAGYERRLSLKNGSVPTLFGQCTSETQPVQVAKPCFSKHWTKRQSHKTCSVFSCKGSHASLHRIPVSEETKAKWLDFIFKGNPPESVDKRMVVCSKHFSPDSFSNLGQYEAGLASRLILKNGAVPTSCPTDASAEVNLHSSDDPNQTTENDLRKGGGCSDEDLDFCDQDSVASSVDTIIEEMFIDGLDPALDCRLSTEIDSLEEDSDSDVILHQNKRPRLPSTSDSPEEADGGNEKDNKSSIERWHSADETDDEPPHPVFTPVQAPGPKCISNSCSNPLKFFQLFFSKTILQEIVSNTNAYGTKCQKTEEEWENISMKELESFIALVIFMGLFKCSSLQDYWRESEYFGLCFPGQIMSYQKFLSISNTLHLSETNKDEENKKMKGTSAYEHLGKIQPMYQVIREACKTNFHPFQNITVNERIEISQPRTRQCMKNKATSDGYKLFALSDCSTGYTWDFFVYEGKSCASQTQGLSYEAVMALVDDNILGTGYKLFVDKFYSSATLFRDLLHKDVWACGPVWTNRKGFPRTKVNSLPKDAPRGTMRWIRDHELLFVHWKDSQELQMCSTFHKAYGGDTVQRKVKRHQRSRTFVDIPIPASVLEYDRIMEAMDTSNCVTRQLRLIHKPRKWYQSVFYHFLDIAVENAFILQELTAKAKNQRAMTRQAFLEMLILKLTAGVHVSSPASSSSPSSPAPASTSFHKPKHITQDSTAAGRKCELCNQETTVMCVTCDVMLCFQPQRDCFNEWHEEQGL